MVLANSTPKSITAAMQATEEPAGSLTLDSYTFPPLSHPSMSQVFPVDPYTHSALNHASLSQVSDPYTRPALDQAWQAYKENTIDTMWLDGLIASKAIAPSTGAMDVVFYAVPGHCSRTFVLTQFGPLLKTRKSGNTKQQPGTKTPRSL